MNAGISRWLTNRRLTTTSAFANASSVLDAAPASPPSKTKWKLVLDSVFGWTSRAPSLTASSMSSTGGRVS